MTYGLVLCAFGHRWHDLAIQRWTRLGAAAAPVTLGLIHPALPLGGLKPVSEQWAPCGALTAGQDPAVLGPGATTWLSVTFDVLIKCPGPLPVQFVVEYNVQAQPAASTSMPGFPDLGHVPYAGCPAAGN